MNESPTYLFQFPHGRLRIGCDSCRRKGSWSVARLGEKFGADIELADLLIALTASCEWQIGPRQPPPRKYQARCLARILDLGFPHAPPVLKVAKG